MLTSAQRRFNPNSPPGTLETAHDAERHPPVEIIEELGAGLRREKMERAAVEDALTAAREDYAQAKHEVMTLQRNQPAGPAAAARRQCRVGISIGRLLFFAARSES